MFRFVLELGFHTGFGCYHRIVVGIEVGVGSVGVGWLAGVL